MTVTPELAIAEHVASCRFEQIPAAAIAAAKRSLVDGMAALIAGSRAEGIAQMLTLVEHWGGFAESRIFATGRRAPAPLAAWVNGAQMRALELDDCTDVLPLHPTAALLPALLAAMDLKPISGKDLVRALAVAQDLKIRFGLCLAKNAMQSGRNNIFRVFAATAGVAAALRLDPTQTLNALGISASYGAGDAQCIIEGSMALRAQFGSSAMGAIHACLLARLGFTGPHHFLTGRYGYLTSFEPEHDLGVLTHDLGSRFEGVRISIKPYAACRCTHAAIDLAREVRSQLGEGEGTQVTSIEVTVSPEVYNLVGGPREAKLRPSSSAAAQFSLNFMVAAVLTHGEAGLAATGPARLSDHDVLRLAERIHVKPDDRHRTGDVVGLTTMEVKTGAGKVLTLQSEQPLGGPTNVIQPRELHSKLLDCVAHSGREIPLATIDQFLARTFEIEAEPAASPIFEPFA